MTTEIKKQYYETGKISAEVPCSNGVKHGVEKCYYESGKIELEVPYENDQKHGLEKQYYESGKIMSKIHYEDGIINKISIRKRSNKS